MTRSRIIFLVATLVCIPIGLATRLLPLPEFIGAHAGDVIWAMMVYFGFRFIFIRQSPYVVAAVSFAFAAAIECSQLIDSEVFDLVRDNTIGRLIFGHGFLWIDFLRYAIGILLGLTFTKIQTSYSGL